MENLDITDSSEVEGNRRGVLIDIDGGNKNNYITYKNITVNKKRKTSYNVFQTKQ